MKIPKTHPPAELSEKLYLLPNKQGHRCIGIPRRALLYAQSAEHRRVHVPHATTKTAAKQMKFHSFGKYQLVHLERYICW